MITVYRKFKKDEKANTVVEFSLLIFLFFTLFFIGIDIFLYILQSADLQRVHALIGEQIKNRVAPIVAAGYDGTWTPANTLTTAYCDALNFKYLCKNIIITSIPENSYLITNFGNNITPSKFCYSKGILTCSSTGTYISIPNPFNNTNHHVIMTVTAYPFAFVRSNFMNMTGPSNITAQSVITLNN